MKDTVEVPIEWLKGLVETAGKLAVYTAPQTLGGFLRYYRADEVNQLLGYIESTKVFVKRQTRRKDGE